MPTWGFRFCGQHGGRVQFRPGPDVPVGVGWKAWSATSEADPRRDRRRSPRSGRRADVQPRTAAGEGAVRPPLSVSLVWSIRFRAGERMRLRRRLLPDLGGDVRVPALRITRAVRRGRPPRLRRRIRTLGRIARIRVRLAPLRSPCRVRCDPLFLRRLVRRLIPLQLSGPRTVQQPLYHSTASFFPLTGPPVERTPAHDETETPTDVGPEDVLPRPLVDVPDSVCGNLREPGGRGGRGERPQCAHGDDLGPGCESGPSARLVPPRRIRRPDAGRMAGSRRANSRSLAREAEARALMRERRPDTLGRDERCLPVPLRLSINSDRGTQTTIAPDHRSGWEGSWPRRKASSPSARHARPPSRPTRRNARNAESSSSRRSVREGLRAAQSGLSKTPMTKGRGRSRAAARNSSSIPESP